MSYYNNPIAEILNALAASNAGEANVNQRGTPQPQYSRFPQQFYYNPMEDEDDDDDYDYYQVRYPDYYSQLFPGFAPAPLPFVPQRSFRGTPPYRSESTQAGFNEPQFPPQPTQRSRAPSQQRQFKQSRQQSVGDMLEMLNGGGNRKASDAGADLDAEIAAAIRKELQSKDSKADLGSSTILDTLKEDVEKQEDDASAAETGATASRELGSTDSIPLTFNTSPTALGGPTDTSGKVETPKQSKATINPPPGVGNDTGPSSTLPNPIIRHHSSVKTKDPKPKIEVSQRNTKNPKLPYSPSANVYDLQDEYNIVLAIPGASLNDLDIDFHPVTNEIVVKGTINNTSLFDEKSLKHSEIRAGSIERRIKFPTLPKIVDDKIKAKYLNGLLTIKVPKDNDESLKKPKRKVTIEDVPDEELEYEEHGGFK